MSDINDLKDALMRDDRKAVVHIFQTMLNTFEIKDEEISRLEGDLKTVMSGLSAYNVLPDLREFLKQIDMIIASGIDKMAWKLGLNYIEISEYTKNLRGKGL